MLTVCCFADVRAVLLVCVLCCWCACCFVGVYTLVATTVLINRSVEEWNVYDHGVNNAEGALRWPGELYRLNGSLAEGLAALKLLTGKLDLYQKQVQGTMCAD